MDIRDELKSMLDDHYGNCRNDEHKEEIIDFLESNIEAIKYVFEKHGIIPGIPMAM
jgi:hypothetical protein